MTPIWTLEKGWLVDKDKLFELEKKLIKEANENEGSG